ncbi:hypothetical protein HDK77DRAFT_283054 [Phyllosticta capitalensis]
MLLRNGRRRVSLPSLLGRPWLVASGQDLIVIGRMLSVSHNHHHADTNAPAPAQEWAIRVSGRFPVEIRLRSTCSPSRLFPLSPPSIPIHHIPIPNHLSLLRPLLHPPVAPFACPSLCLSPPRHFHSLLLLHEDFCIFSAPRTTCYFEVHLRYTVPGGYSTGIVQLNLKE